MERIILVNENDEPIGSKLRSEIESTDVGRASGLWVTDLEGNILLVRRALTVKFHPGLLSYAVTGAVGENETYLAAITREMEEELGIRGFTPTISIKYLASGFGRRWYMQIFTLTIPHNYNFTPDPNEVAELRWFSKEELIEEQTKNPEQFVSGFSEETKIFLNM